MKLYILAGEVAYDGSYVFGIFDSFEKAAESFLNNAHPEADTYFIEEITLNTERNCKHWWIWNADKFVWEERDYR